MELKTKYQYSYFIHPYIVEESNYSNYILKLLKDKHCSLKIFEKEKDLNLYTYFLPKIKDAMFWTFGMDKEKKRTWEKLKTTIKANILADKECTIFEYNLGEDIQGKIGQENGIFFEIPKIEIICFKTGICFILIKTNLEEDGTFSNILNFNYKFRDINSEYTSLKDFENINLQTSSLKDIKDLSKIIKNITGKNIGAKELNLTDERYLTYSYVCVEQENWNETAEFKNIEDEFIKYMNVMQYNSQVNVDKESIMENTLSLGEYAKLGISRQGMVLFTSSIQMQNYTKLLFSYEREYLYTYILALYKKIYLQKIANEFTKKYKKVSAKSSFLGFIENVLAEDETDDETGNQIQKKLSKALEIEKLYNKVKQKYDIYYKNLNIGKNNKAIFCILLILIAILIFNIINYIGFLGKI